MNKRIPIIFLLLFFVLSRSLLAKPPEQMMYSVQVGSYHSEKLAKALVADFKSKGFHPCIIKLFDNKGELWHIVQVNAFKTQSQAMQCVEEVKANTHMACRVKRIAKSLLDNRIYPKGCGSQVQTQFSVYVRNCNEFINNFKNNAEYWRYYSDNQIKRILLSLSGQQLNKLEQLKLIEFMSFAKEQEIQVELLLDDPLWILPEHHQQMISSIKKMKNMSFSGLHLDLEPNQLKGRGYSEDYLLTQLLHTLKVVGNISPWPIGLSLHPRYFFPDQSQVCVGCALSKMQIKEVALKIYVSNPKRVVELAKPIMDKHQKLMFSIAQNVELALSAKESYAGTGRARFHASMFQLATTLTNTNFSTILIQSWKGYLGLNP